MILVLSCGHRVRVERPFFVFFGTDRYRCPERHCAKSATANEHPLITMCLGDGQ